MWILAVASANVLNRLIGLMLVIVVVLEFANRFNQSVTVAGYWVAGFLTVEVVRLTASYFVPGDDWHRRGDALLRSDRRRAIPAHRVRAAIRSRACC